MKKQILALTFIMTGCQSPLDHMLNNKFSTIPPLPVPSSLANSWTGNMGPYLVTFKFEQNGSGYFCYSYGTADVIMKTKSTGNTIHIQDGTQIDITEIMPNKITISSNYFGKNHYTLIDDKELKSASIYCKTQIQQIEKSL